MANSYAFVLSKNTYPDAWQANFLGVDQGTMIVYASTDTLSSSTVLYADSRLTQPIYGNPDLWLGAQLLTDDAVKYAVAIGGSGGIDPVSNPTTTTSSTSTTSTTTTSTSTTTTTTAAPTVYSFTGGNGFGSKGEACFAGQTSTYYASVPEPAITNGTVIYTDSGLTTPQSLYPYIAISGIAYECSTGGVLSNGSNC